MPQLLIGEANDARPGSVPHIPAEDMVLESYLGNDGRLHPQWVAKTASAGITALTYDSSAAFGGGDGDYQAVLATGAEGERRVFRVSGTLRYFGGTAAVGTVTPFVGSSYDGYPTTGAGPALDLGAGCFVTHFVGVVEVPAGGQAKVKFTVAGSDGMITMSAFFAVEQLISGAVGTVVVA